MASEKLKKLAFWSKFVGWCLLVFGILSALIGLIAFIIGAIPGIITAFMGWKLISAGTHAEKLSYTKDDEKAFVDFVQNYLSYFKIQGILIIICIVIYILVFLFAGTSFFYLLNY